MSTEAGGRAGDQERSPSSWAPPLMTTPPPYQALRPETGKPFSTPPSPFGSKGQPLKRLWEREERETG